MTTPLHDLTQTIEQLIQRQIETARQLEQTSSRESLYASAIDELFSLLDRIDLTPFGKNGPQALLPKKLDPLDWSQTPAASWPPNDHLKLEQMLMKHGVPERLQKANALGSILGATARLCQPASVLHDRSFAAFVLRAYRLDPKRFGEFTFQLVQADLYFRRWLEANSRAKACLRMFDAIWEFMAALDPKTLGQPLAEIAVDLDAMTAQAEAVPVELRKRLVRIFTDNIIEEKYPEPIDLEKAFFESVFPVPKPEGIDPWRLISELVRALMVIKAMSPTSPEVTEFAHLLGTLQHGVIEKQLKAAEITVFGHDLALFESPYRRGDKEVLLGYLESPPIKATNQGWVMKVEELKAGPGKSRQLYFDIKRLGATVKGYEDIGSQFTFYAFS